MNWNKEPFFHQGTASTRATTLRDSGYKVSVYRGVYSGQNCWFVEWK